MEIRWLNEYSEQFLMNGYIPKGMTIKERIYEIGAAAEKILFIEGIGEKIAKAICNGWISPSTPIWTNFGTKRGLPISCFNTFCPDSIEGILSNVTEIGMMSKHGGGTAVYMGDLRHRGAPIKGNGESNGSKSFLPLFQTTTNVVSQGGTRRGYIAAYQDIFHKDFPEWLDIRGEGDEIQSMTWGACVPTWWLKEMREGDIEKQNIWAKLIKKKFETGLPYIFFTDNANNGESVPEVYRGKGLIKSSNLCTEVMLPIDEWESFVCDLASMNDLYYEEWKDTDAVELCVYLLEAAQQDFIKKASKIKGFERAVSFAERHNAIGIGRMGYHSFLQSKMIPFESLEARKWNLEIQQTIFTQAMKASKEMVAEYGEPAILRGVGRRHSTLIAIAPTTSTAFIQQVSQSVEVSMGNCYIKDLAKGKFLIKNQELAKLLKTKEKDTDEVWYDIVKNHGSVLHLDFLTDQEKMVFKTAHEVDQNEVIVQAAQRQKYIDQGQSINLFISSELKAKDVNALFLKAHDMGLKSLYYNHNFNAAQHLTKKLLTCSSCEG